MVGRITELEILNLGFKQEGLEPKRFRLNSVILETDGIRFWIQITPYTDDWKEIKSIKQIKQHYETTRFTSREKVYDRMW